MTDLQSVHCWGRNFYGSTGNGNLADSTVLVPTRVVQGELPTSVKFTNVDCGTYHCVGYATNKLLYSWGFNEGNALSRPVGDVYTTSSGSPIVVSTPYRD